MRGEMVEGAFDQLADGALRRQASEIELAFLRADLLIDPFQHGEVQRVLVAEVVIDQLLVDARTRRDLVDARARETTGGELAPRGGQQLLPGSRRIAPSRRLAVCLWFRHFQPNS